MITIGRFHANYYLAEGTPDRHLLEHRLNKLVQEHLPELVTAYLRQTPGDEDAVYRIRRLRLSLWLDGFHLEENVVAEKWARLMVQAVVHTILYGSDQNVVRFDNPAQYVASFLVDLMAGLAWSHWKYSSFRPLSDLSVGQVTSYILASQPELILPVAEILERQGQLTKCLQHLNAQDADLIWERGLGFADLGASLMPDNLGDLLGALPLPLASGGAGSFSRQRLHVYLSLVSTRGAHDPRAAVVADQFALLSQLHAARPVPYLWQALARQEITSLSALGPMLASLDSSLDRAKGLLGRELGTQTGRARLAQLVESMLPGIDSQIDLTRGKRARSPDVGTSFAGLALLLPTLRDAHLEQSIGRAGIYQLLVDAAGPAYRALARSDPAPIWMAGIPPHELEQARDAAIAWPVQAQQADEQSSAYLPVTVDVLRSFARTLRGFEQSSPSYIAQQFLNLPGRLSMSEDALDVYLHKAPLGIVLHMAGHSGDRGPIPWLAGRSLSIHLPVT